jgi:hypothetical protein
VFLLQPLHYLYSTWWAEPYVSRSPSISQFTIPNFRNNISFFPRNSRQTRCKTNTRRNLNPDKAIRSKVNSQDSNFSFNIYRVLRKFRNAFGSCIPSRSAKAVQEPIEETVHPDPSASTEDVAPAVMEEDEREVEAEEREVTEEPEQTNMMCCGLEMPFDMSAKKEEESSEE